MRGARPEISEFMLLPVASIMLAWPGCLAFLIFGLPTLYWLLRVNRTGFLLFAFFGAVYTPLPWVILQIVQHPPRYKYLQLVPTFAEIGIANGIFTRLIVVGRRFAPTIRKDK
ncbi:MAG: hypothetical protein M3Y72_14275 [Acidobacteriota bacterium]|nr:hypothetical protein [Acidobacteriota bacterium]